MSLLPSTPDLSSSESEPRVVGVDDEAADELIAALSSTTARQLLTTLHEDPSPPSKLAEEVETSLQNVQYHLGRLEEADAVQVVGTAYSEKGREMDVYGPADQPLVLVAGTDDDTSLLKSALSRLLGAVAILGLASLVVQELYGEGSLIPSFSMASTGGAPASGGGGSGGGDAGAATETATPTATSTPTPTESGPSIAEATTTTTRTATETATPTPMATETTRVTAEAAGSGGGLPPGLLFFVGGLLALVVVLALAYTR